MPSRVVTKRRVKRRQQRLVSKNAKRNARSVRKYRKSAKSVKSAKSANKVMRGGGGVFEWKNNFSVIIISYPNYAQGEFTLSVNKKSSEANSYDITLIFDLNKGPLNLLTVIFDLIDSFKGSKLTQNGEYYRNGYRPVPLADNSMLNKASKARKEAMNGGIAAIRLDKFVKEDGNGNAVKNCEIKMTLLDNGELRLTEFTSISATEIEPVFTSGKKFTVYKWGTEKLPVTFQLIAELGSITQETLMAALNDLGKEYYTINRPIQSMTEQIDSEVISRSEKIKKGLNEKIIAKGKITFKNGDTFEGTYEPPRMQVLSDGKSELKSPWLFCIDGTYIWTKDGSKYTGKSFIQNSSDGLQGQSVIETGFTEYVKNIQKRLILLPHPNSRMNEGGSMNSKERQTLEINI